MRAPIYPGHRSHRSHRSWGGLAALLILVSGCASPLAGIPLQAVNPPPEALAAPMEDGTVYVLAEGGRMTSEVKLRSLWRRKATLACDGDYMVLSEHASARSSGGIVGGRAYEGFVRCFSPEGMGNDPDRRAERSI